MNLHINLIVEGDKNKGTQPVEVEYLSPYIYRVLYSPGFVEGIAAGDVIRVIDEKSGKFVVVTYGGNVSVKISSASSIVGFLPEIDLLLSDVKARRDGNLEHVAVWTIPVSSGFGNIEKAIELACKILEEPFWWYGNVYDADGQPLNWWSQ